MIGRWIWSVGRKLTLCLLVILLFSFEVLNKLDRRRNDRHRSLTGSDTIEDFGFDADPDAGGDRRPQHDRDDCDGPDLFKWASQMDLEPTEVETSTGPSRPLPYVEIHRPTADRGADDVREHLDGKRCLFCGVPVGDDERFVEADKFGMRVTRPICKNHLEHPESWHAATTHTPEQMGYCPSCGAVTRQDGYREECGQCNPVDLDTLDDRQL